MTKALKELLEAHRRLDPFTQALGETYATLIVAGILGAVLAWVVVELHR